MTNITRRDALIKAGSTVAGLTLSAALLHGAEGKTSRTIPAVPGKFSVKLRKRVPVEQKSKEFKMKTEEVSWEASETVIIICDMWADHPCKLAAQRVGRMAPQMNKVISLARDHGVAVIHAPSSGIKYYEETAYRTRMKQAKAAKPPVPIRSWCYLDDKLEAALPIDDSKSRMKGGRVRACDDPEPKPNPNSDRHQHPDLKIIGYDGVSDDGQEIYNFIQQEERKNIVLMGVHTNMCVLGRPFGIRQMKYMGKNVVLCRDLTDALYDPRDYPYVSHTRGTELVIEHIEKYWCPSILGEDLTKVIRGSNDPVK